jgi:hypothetical protein
MKFEEYDFPELKPVDGIAKFLGLPEHRRRR